MLQFLKKRISRADLLLIGSLCIIGAVSLLVVIMMKSQNGNAVQITVDGAAYGTYPLTEEQTIPIKVHGVVTNTLQISEGKAKMIQADCPDKLCLHQSAISGQGETIVCLPNKVVAEVKGKEKAAFDAISR